MSRYQNLADDIASWKVWSLIASAVSGLVVIIAFLIPSFEEQYDRYKSKQVVDGYAQVGDALMKEKQYRLAEDAFATAFEMSNNQRLDIEISRLRAKIEIINEENEWGSPLPTNLKEVDFIYFLHLSEYAEDHQQMSIAHSSYALYLASQKKWEKSQKHLEKALELDSQNYGATVDLGNLHSEMHRIHEAIAQYQRAIALRPQHYLAYYNLGLVYLETKQIEKGIEFLKKAQALKPDPSIQKEIDQALKK